YLFSFVLAKCFTQNFIHHLTFSLEKKTPPLHLIIFLRGGVTFYIHYPAKLLDNHILSSENHLKV
ncbi:hypothetical protein ACSYHE_13630, partial [Geobacillus thermodenitrificans subsp. calidus]